MLNNILNNKFSFSKIGFYFLLAFIFFLPYDSQINNYLLGSFIFFTIIDSQYRKNYSINNISLLPKIIILFSVLIYIFLSLSLLYSGNKVSGIIKLAHRISLLIFPIIFIGYETKKIDLNIILKVFVTGVLISSVICITMSLLKIVSFSDSGIVLNHSVNGNQNIGIIKAILIRKSYLSYAYLSRFIHPSYLAMFINFSIAIIYYYIKNGHLTKPKNFLLIMLIMLFEIMLFLLSSRAGIISGLLILLSIVFLEIFAYKKALSGFIFFIFLISISFFIVKNKRMQSNMKDVIEISKNGLEKPKHYDDRIYIWNGAISIIKNNFWFGIGIGNMDKELQKSYTKTNFKTGYIHEYNTHNQFLDIWLSIGFIGFLILLTMAVLLFIYSIREKYFLLWAFTTIIFINMLFESLLNRLAGVVFFSLFLSLLLFLKESLKKQEIIDYSFSE